MRIKDTTLLDGSTCEYGDFNVFVGGNGVGKTTFLLELFSHCTGSSRPRLFWISGSRYSSNDIPGDMLLLQSSFSRRYDGTTPFYFSQAAKDANGLVELNDNYRFSEADRISLSGATDSSIFDTPKVRKPFVALSSCDARLGLQDSVEVAGLNAPPQDPINVLYRKKELLDQIGKTVRERFEFNFVLLDHTKRQLHLGVSKDSPPLFDNDAGNLQDEYERIEKWRVEHFQPITESGHGVRSMIRLLTSLFEPVNKVIVIDEPELHLYPSQKRWLGKQLVDLANKQGKQVFLVTHDPIILQGVLDASTKTTVFRVDRNSDGKGIIKSCPLNPSDIPATRNQEQYLQALFYQRCIVVEGASDRSFYQNILEDFTAIADKDVGFVVCGGKGSGKHLAEIASRIGLQPSFIFDLDMVFFEQQIIRDIYQLLGGVDDPLKELNAALETDSNIANAKQQKERDKAIRSATDYSDKAGVSSQWKSANGSLLEDVFTNLGKVGIFIVPNGTLESWAPDATPKVRFAELAPDMVRSDEGLKIPLHSFLRKVARFLGVTI